jgi:hypothetical protein
VSQTTPVTFASPTKPAGWTWEATNAEVAAARDIDPGT